MILWTGDDAAGKTLVDFAAWAVGEAGRVDEVEAVWTAARIELDSRKAECSNSVSEDFCAFDMLSTSAILASGPIVDSDARGEIEAVSECRG